MEHRYTVDSKQLFWNTKSPKIAPKSPSKPIFRNKLNNHLFWHENSRLTSARAARTLRLHYPPKNEAIFMFLTTATTPFALSCEMSYPLTYDSACKALGLSNEADLLTVALGIADKHPFGFTIGDMRSHAAPYNARLSGPDFAFGNACNTLVVIYERAVASGIAKRIPIRPYQGMSDFAWRKITQAEICKYLAQQVADGTITSVEAHKREFDRCKQTVGERGDESLWMRLRVTTGADLLVAQAKERKAEAKAEAAAASAEARNARSVARKEAEQQRAKEDRLYYKRMQAQPAAVNLNLNLNLSPAQLLQLAAAMLKTKNAQLADHLNKIADKLE